MDQTLLILKRSWEEKKICYESNNERKFAGAALHKVQNSLFQCYTNNDTLGSTNKKNYIETREGKERFF